MAYAPPREGLRLLESIFAEKTMTDTLEASIEPLVTEARVPLRSPLDAAAIEGDNGFYRAKIADASVVPTHRVRRSSIFAPFLEALRRSRRVQTRRFLRQHRHLIASCKRRRAFNLPSSPECNEHVD